jgi:hypothetical protein
MHYELDSMPVRLTRLLQQPLHIHDHTIPSLIIKLATNLETGLFLHMVLKKTLKFLYRAILVLRRNR